MRVHHLLTVKKAAGCCETHVEGLLQLKNTKVST